MVGLQGKVLLGEVTCLFICICAMKEMILFFFFYLLFFSWLRRKWSSSPVVIAGAEGEEYLPTIDDVGSSLVFMYTPVTEEGVKGDPHYKYTDFVKAGKTSSYPISYLSFVASPLLPI